MIIQILGKVKFNITLDPSTWIFDDRKVELEHLKKGLKSGEMPIAFEDNREWNREILEGGAKPPTLNSEIKYKKTQLLEGTFFMNIASFINNAEPFDATHVRYSNENENIDIPLSELEYTFFQFSKDGKRLYEDGLVDVYLVKDTIELKLAYATKIELI